MSGCIHWKVSLLVHPASCSKEGHLFVGNGGGFRFKGLNVRLAGSCGLLPVPLCAPASGGKVLVVPVGPEEAPPSLTSGKVSF